MVAIQQDAAGFTGETPALTSGRSLRQIVWNRLRRDKLAMICLGILVFYYLTAIIGPFLIADPGQRFDPGAISDLGGRPIPLF